MTRVIESRLIEQTFTRLLESQELWLLVEEVARSPAVTEAITQQSLGFADQVAERGAARARAAPTRGWSAPRAGCGDGGMAARAPWAAQSTPPA